MVKNHRGAPPRAQSGIQRTGGSGSLAQRQNDGRAVQAVRAAHPTELTAKGACRRVWHWHREAGPVDWAWLHARIGQQVPENDFWDSLLTKAGLLSA